jgi:hypothetical protein
MRKALIILIMVLLTTTLASAINISNGLVAHYSFDGYATGTTITSNVSLLNNGSLQGSGGGFTTGKVGNSWWSDGTINRYWALADAGDVFDWGSGEWAINYWAYKNTTAADNMAYARSATNCPNVLIGVVCGNLECLYGATGQSCWNSYSGVTVGINNVSANWTMFTVMKRGGRTITYRNAILVTNVSNSITHGDESASAVIGKYVNSYITGSIDEVSFWKGASLSTENVSFIYNDGAGSSFNRLMGGEDVAANSTTAVTLNSPANGTFFEDTLPTFNVSCSYTGWANLSIYVNSSFVGSNATFTSGTNVLITSTKAFNFFNKYNWYANCSNDASSLVTAPRTFYLANSSGCVPGNGTSPSATCSAPAGVLLSPNCQIYQTGTGGFWSII